MFQFHRDPLEAAAEGLKLKILEMCNQKDIDTAAVAMGMADVLAHVAVALDRSHGTQSLKDRLHEFNKRVEETYRLVHAIADSKGAAG